MKNTHFIFIVLSFFALFSCTSTEEDIFSCDETINEWAHQNLDNIRTMSYQDFTKLSDEKQRASFRVISPIKRKGFWKNKLEYLNNNIQSEAEQDLIFFVEDLVEEFSFEQQLTDEEYFSIESELFDLVKKANWSKTKMFYAFGTLQKFELTEFNRTVIGDINDNEEPDCNCKWGWCADNSDCEDADCKDTDLGCGFLLLGECTKMCAGNP